MSGHARKALKEGNSTVVVGSGKQRHRLGPRTRLSLVGLVAIVIILVVALLTAVLVHAPSAKVVKTPTTATKTTKLSPVSEKTLEAHDLGQKGDYAGAQKALDDLLKTTTDNASRAEIYSQKASLAAMQKDYATALAAAVQADKAAPTYGTAQYEGYLAQLAGDNKAALTYYQIALKRLDKNSPTYGYTANKIQAMINEVSK